MRAIDYLKKIISKYRYPSRDAAGKAVDVLFIQCPPWDIVMPPLGAAYLSGYLRKYGYKTRVCDLNIELYNSASQDSKYLWEQKSYNCWVDEGLFKDSWARLEGITNSCLEDALKKTEAEYIGLSVNFASIHFTSQALRIIKRLNNKAKIILGGWGCVNSHMRSLFPKELVDIFVVGEGEETLRGVLEAFGSQKEMSDITGAVLSKDNGKIYKPRPAIMNLDNIPWPTYEEFNLSRYKHRALPLFTSRGCIGSCSFCNDWPLSKPHRFRSAQNVFEEIKYHTEKNHIRYFSFKDLACNGDIGRLNALCDSLIASDFKINWDSQAIPRKEMTYQLLSKLKESGCGTLIYGVESFSNNVLKRMRKLFTKEIVESVLKDTHRAGINAMINIIVGFPGESENDFRENLEAIKGIRKYIGQIGAISVCLVNNDSDLENNFQSYNIVLPEEASIRAKKWASRDGTNTYELRKERAEKIVSLARELGLKYETTTI